MIFDEDQEPLILKKSEVNLIGKNMEQIRSYFPNN